MKHSDEQLAAARDLLSDGQSRSEAARKIADQFGVSVRTGERVVAAVGDTVSPDMSDTELPSDTGMVDYTALALRMMAKSLIAADEAGDDEARADRAERLAGMISKAKVRWAP